ncbi:MAG: GNAT family N-acetyltransferase [Cytophagales bacterium]|nr:GNAT family N-acetyltransferase [Bernardetiaceae bacterium]MDW8204436.1 GNAT family N-acetyltransferase [Cytophagales bacterium]
MSVIIRKGTAADLPAAHRLIVELAIYEKAEHEVITTPEQMLQDGFGDRPAYGFYVAALTPTNQIVGMALYYTRYSTWKGRCLYLEDLIVTQDWRGKGIGKLLFDAIVRECLEQNMHMLTWQVLDWNTPAIEFYKRLGAHLDAEWLNGKLFRHQLEQWTFGHPRA